MGGGPAGDVLVWCRFGFRRGIAPPSAAVYVFNYPEKGPDYWDGHFHRDLRIPGEWLYRGTSWLLTKVLLSGVGIGAIAYHVGLRPKQSGVAVSGGITSTIIWATLYVLLVHFIFAFVEF